MSTNPVHKSCPQMLSTNAVKNSVQESCPQILSTNTVHKYCPQILSKMMSTNKSLMKVIIINQRFFEYEQFINVASNMSIIIIMILLFCCLWNPLSFLLNHLNIILYIYRHCLRLKINCCYHPSTCYIILFKTIFYIVFLGTLSDETTAGVNEVVSFFSSSNRFII